MTEREELEAVRKEFGSYVVAENAYREILALRKRVAELEQREAARQITVPRYVDYIDDLDPEPFI